MLTKESVARDEWNHLLRLFNITNISQFASGHLSWNVAKADTARKIRRRRTSGCEMKTNVDFGVKDCRSVSYSAEFMCISQPPRDTQSNKFIFGSHQYRETCGERFEPEHSIELSSVAIRSKYDKEFHWYRIASPQYDHSPEQRWPSWEKSTRTYDKNLVVNRETICLRSTSTRWSGECLCPRQWRQWYIFAKSIKRVYTQRRTRTSQLFNLSQKLLPDQSQEIKWHIYNWLEYTSMDENYLVERRTCQAVGSKRYTFLSVSVLCPGKIHEYPRSINSRQNVSSRTLVFLGPQRNKCVGLRTFAK